MGGGLREGHSPLRPLRPGANLLDQRLKLDWAFYNFYHPREAEGRNTGAVWGQLPSFLVPVLQEGKKNT